MERLDRKSAIQLFNSPKKTLKYLDKVLAKDKTELFIKATEPGFYSLFDETKTEVCSADNVYTCLVGLLHQNYGVGKSNMPAWACPEGQKEEEFSSILAEVEKQNKFTNLEKGLDRGGVFHYSSESESVTFKMPDDFNFNNNNITFRCDNFSDGIGQMDGILSLLVMAHTSQEQ